MNEPKDDSQSHTEEMQDIDMSDCAEVDIVKVENKLNQRGANDENSQQKKNENFPCDKKTPPVVAVPPLQYDEKDEINALYRHVPEVACHFIIDKKIGEGAFSCVYLAKLKHYPEIKETFALKHVIPTTHPSRIENELRCLLNIGGQDNVMGVKLAMRNRDHVVIVMPFFPHDKFQDYLYLMDIDETREYMKNLLTALKRVHQFNVIHRDVKPVNFLYNRQLKQYSLVDFGLASGSCLKDRDSEKYGKGQDKKPAQALTLKGPAIGGVDSRIPLSPSKQDAGKRNQANLARAGKSNGAKGKGGMKGPHPSRPGFTLSLPSTSGMSIKTIKPDKEGLCDCFGKPQICSLCVARNNQVAPRAGTAGFRSPEVLMKSPDQGTAVDIWSAGVIFLSILSGRYPFFKANDDLGYLAQVVSILGSSECIKAAWSFGKMLTLSESVPPVDLKASCLKLRTTQMSFRAEACALGKEIFSSWANVSDEPFDLLHQMLNPDPKERITAEEALNHPFFNNSEHQVQKS